MIRHFLFTLLLIGGVTLTASAQVSLVPAYHPVYDWLYSMRTQGLLDRYDYEAIPLRRGQISGFLKELSQQSEQLSSTHRALLLQFQKEFDLEWNRRYAKKNFLKGDQPFVERMKSIVKERDELHLYVYADSQNTLTVDMNVGFGLFSGEEDFAIYPYRNRSLSRRTTFVNPNGYRIFATTQGIIGLHAERIRSWSPDMGVYKYDPYLSKNFKYMVTATDVAYHNEGLATVNLGNFEFTAGRGLQKFGAGTRDNLTFSREGAPIDWIRFRYDTKYVSYLMMHGKLTARPVHSFPVQGTDTIGMSSFSPDRWVAYQRLEVRPFKWIQFAWYEMLNYSSRSADWSYLNPANRLSLAEWENQDRDNGWIGIDGWIRPLPGLELYGEVLVDDLGGVWTDFFNFSDQMTYLNNKFARRMGLTYNHQRYGQLNIDYQRIEPHIFSHRDPLNAHVEKGILLGTQVGPNSDRFMLEYRRWFAWRGFLTTGWMYTRRGLNILDARNRLLINTGSNPELSYLFKPRPEINFGNPGRFLDGDLHRLSTFYIEFSIEPIRTLRWLTRIQRQTVLEGERLPNYFFAESSIIVGF